MRALDELVRSSGPRLLAVAKRACRRAADAEDAVQQALLAASTGMQAYRGEGSATAWLATLVTRCCYRLNERYEAELPSGARPCGCDEADETQGQGEELAAAVGAALMEVSRTDRLAFLLSVEGFTSVEIAERFGLSHDSVRSRLKRVRKVLRARLAPDTPAPSRRTTGHDRSPLPAPHR